VTLGGEEQGISSKVKPEEGEPSNIGSTSSRIQVARRGRRRGSDLALVHPISPGVGFFSLESRWVFSIY